MEDLGYFVCLFRDGYFLVPKMRDVVFFVHTQLVMRFDRGSALYPVYL